MCISFACPSVAISLANRTVSPNTQNFGDFPCEYIIPAITGPLWIPTLICNFKFGLYLISNFFVAAITSADAVTMSTA